MIPFLVRLAVIGSALWVAINVVITWMRALTGPRKAEALPPTLPPSPARDMVADAVKCVTAIQVEIAGLKDPEMWQAASAFEAAVGRLNAAVISDPERYRLARRYLGQILPAAEEAAVKFAALYRTTGDDAKAPFLELFGELTSAFDQAAKDYMQATAAEVLVEADVLRDLLERARRH